MRRPQPLDETAGVAGEQPLRGALGIRQQRTRTMAKGQKKSNKEIRKPKAEKKKKNASNPSTKGLIQDARR